MNDRKWIPRIAAALAVFALAPGGAMAACLTGFLGGLGATGAGDAVEIGAVRAAVAAACPCAVFDGDGPDRDRDAYEACADAEIQAAVDRRDLRRACRTLVGGIFDGATCGFAPNPQGESVPCVRRAAKSGAVTCRIGRGATCPQSTATFTQVTCPDFDFCLDAADTNGDLRIDASDTGTCGVAQAMVSEPGFAEPHTPGSGDALQMPASPNVQALLGAAVDLNRVTTRRTFRRTGASGSPRAVLILVPGFLGGAASFDPIARDLVEASGGSLEVWAIDRRPNQLEDRLGAFHASAATTPAIREGLQFYMGDLDRNPMGNFPGNEDFDVNGNGVADPPLALTDPFGVTRGFIRLVQDDLRFSAHWGIDTWMRDWRILVDEARAITGPGGLVLFGGHSLGTALAGIFAAYDFDPTAGVDPGHAHIDGLLLLEGGGPGVPAGGAPSLAEYQARVAALAQPGGPDVFLGSFTGIDLLLLGASGEISGIAGLHRPNDAASVQRTPLFAGGPFSLLFRAPATNEAIFGLFLDDDFQPLTFQRASMGFSDNGANLLVPPSPLSDSFYLALPRILGPRKWKRFDDPTLPMCPPKQPNQSPGCAIADNGPPAIAPDLPKVNGVEREVTDIREALAAQFGGTNFIEWYFLSGRQSLDLLYGRDSSMLGDESLLAVTQNAGVDVPVLCIGGSNGLAPQPESFADYLASIATPPADREVVILGGYAHLDPVTASDNEAVPIVSAWIGKLLSRKAPSP